jgi:hypothetical protein
MPEISRFFGIVITMYFNDHNPPHFHVRYEDFRATVSIEALTILDGYLPNRAYALVCEWARMHQPALVANWTSLGEKGTFQRVEPLR